MNKQIVFILLVIVGGLFVPLVAIGKVEPNRAVAGVYSGGTKPTGDLLIDVPSSHWAYEAIQASVGSGLLKQTDGEFNGDKLLSRYQMAVITEKILKLFSPSYLSKTGDEESTPLAGYNSLHQEMANELAQATGNISALQKDVQVFDQSQKGKEHKINSYPNGTSSAAEDSWLTAFASFGLVGEGSHNSPWVRYSGSGSLEFNLPQVSIGIDRHVGNGTFFHGQFDFDSDTGSGGGTSINEAYFVLDKSGKSGSKVSGKLGAFALPFSIEHNGPFRSCNLTVTPSIVNTLWEAIRPYGVELQSFNTVDSHKMKWKFGIVSATDSMFANLTSFMSDRPVSINDEEADDSFGFYGQIGMDGAGDTHFDWSFTYFDNGGDVAFGEESDFIQFGIQYTFADFLIMAQYADGTVGGTGYSEDMTMFYLLANYKINEKNNITLRYDSFEWNDGVLPVFDLDSLTFASNHRVSTNSLLQLEYLMSKNNGVNLDDDLFQIRYKVHF